MPTNAASITVSWLWRNVAWSSGPGANGSVTGAGSGASVPKNTILLIGTPVADPGYVFTAWSHPDVTFSSGNWYGRCTSFGTNTFTANFALAPTPTPTPTPTATPAPTPTPTY